MLLEIVTYIEPPKLRNGFFYNPDTVYLETPKQMRDQHLSC